MAERIRWSYDGGIEKLRALCDVWNGFEKRLLIPFLGIEEFDHFLVHIGDGDTPCSKTLIEVEEGDYIERDENGVYSVLKNGAEINEIHTADEHPQDTKEVPKGQGD